MAKTVCPAVRPRGVARAPAFLPAPLGWPSRPGGPVDPCGTRREGRSGRREARMAALIEDHGIIGDLHTAALVSTDGDIDWLCLPRFDSPSVFASLLDDERGGRFTVRCTGATRVKQMYLPARRQPARAPGARRQRAGRRRDPVRTRLRLRASADRGGDRRGLRRLLPLPPR